MAFQRIKASRLLSSRPERDRLVVLVLAAALSGSYPMAAQVDYASATLRGTVFDPQEKVVPGATVRVSNAATGWTRVAMTEPDGSYYIPALTPATYQIEFEAAGFQRMVATNIALTVGQIVQYDVHLTVGPMNTGVEVSGNVAPLIQVHESQQANTVIRLQVENLPNISRSFTESIYTVPGVVSSHGAALQDPGVGTGFLSSGFSVGGSNGRNNLVTIDGGENDYGSGALRLSHVPIDAVQEFQVNRNAFQAEFGFTIGTAINMVTRGGTNQFHGSAYTYFRNHSTDAANFFHKLANPNSVPFEQSIQSGGTVGGPIQRDKLFFFTAFERQKLDSATVQNLAGEAEFQGIAAQANGYDPSTGTCPNQNTAHQQVTQLCYLTQLANSRSPISPVGVGLLASPVFGPPLAHPILNALVTPNDGTFNGIISVLGAERGIPGYNTPLGRYNNWVSRFDYLPRAQDSLFLRFLFMKEANSVAPQPPTSVFDNLKDYTLTASWIRVTGPRAVNFARVQVVPQNTAFSRTPLPNRSEIDLGNQITLGNPFAFPYEARWKRFQFDDSLSLRKGAHDLKFGASYRPDYYNVLEQLWFGGQWKFADGAIPILALLPPATQSALVAYNIAQGYPAGGPPSTNLTAAQSFLAGTPITLLQADSRSNAAWADWAHSLGIYAQDSWRVSPKLTLNYGARLDYDHEPTPVPHSVYASPRLGLAWDPNGDGKSVVRMGGGLFVAPIEFMIPFYVNLLGTSGRYINQGALVAGVPSPPFPSIFAAWAVQATAATTANPNPALTAAQLASVAAVIKPPGTTAFGSVIYTLGADFKPTYSIQASMSVARQIASDLSLELGYNLYHSVHIVQNVESNFVENSALPVDPFNGPSYMVRPGATAGEPNSSILQNNATSSVGNGIYSGFTASLTRRMNHGLQLQANYTFSRAIDNTSDFSSLSTPFRPDLLKLDRALSDFNITHTLVANAVYTTPFLPGQRKPLSRVLADVTVSPIVYAHSGIPFTLLVPGLSNGTVGHSANARPWQEGRNDGIGPNFISADLRVSKAFYIRRESGLRLDLIAQSQNLLNRINFAIVNNNFPADPNFPLPNGGTLSQGPYRVSGFKPASVTQFSSPLAFTSAYPARQLSFALRLAF
jgi:hypothetical protein